MYSIIYMNKLSELNIADQVRRARNAQGLSLQEIAEKTDLSFGSVTKIASGVHTNPRITNLLKICEVLNIDIKTILSPVDNNVAAGDMTARGVAYVRSLCDIGLAKEITKLIDGVGAHKKIMGKNTGVKTLITVVEYRYRAINKYIDSYKPEQIIELAAGYSPRGMEYASKNKMLYIEADFMDIIHKKAGIIKRLFKKGAGKLVLSGGDILNNEFIVKLISALDKGKKTMVISEGLLAYLKKEEQVSLIENIRTILKSTNGVWITTDIPSLERLNKDFRSDKTVKFRSSKLFGSKSKNVLLSKGYFKTEKEFVAFLESFGLRVDLIESDNKFLDSIRSITDNKRILRENLRRRKLLVVSI